MRKPQLRLSLEHELIVDQFAGGGGASTGIENALGRSPDIAINHDAQAIALHTVNHPTTQHYCEDVFKVNPVEVCGGRPVGLMWLSPDCKHFSKAKGGKPVQKKIRGLAWIAIKWARLVKPRLIVLENVEEFQDWGPLTPENKPCPERKGLTFRRWKKELENCGYVVEHRELRACDYGAPTIRKRLFLIARSDGQPIIWPVPTHGDPHKLGFKASGLRPWRTAAECIDWGIPCPSIFERVRPLAENTLKRIAAGIKRYVIDAAEPFIVPTTHKTVVTANIARIGQTGGGGSYVAAADDPLTTITSKAEHLLVGANLVGVGGRAVQSRPRSVDEPTATMTAKADTVLVAPMVIGAGGPTYSGKPVSAGIPFGSLTTENHRAVVAPVLVQTGYGEREGQAPRALDIEKPVGTLVGTGKHGLVAAFLNKHFTGVVGAPLDKPVPTVTASDHNSLTAAVMSHNYLNDKGGDPAAPAHTITSGGQHHALVKAFLMKYYSEGGQWQSPADPMHTIPTKDRIGLVTVAGEEYLIDDIGMRMLQPRELYRAQGFPEDYKIEITYKGKPLPKDAQVRMCGNSVCPQLAQAIVAANFKFAEMELVA